MKRMLSLVRKDAADDLRSQTLEQLFETAEQFGRVFIFGSHTKKARYRAEIDFETIPGVKLKAGSEFDLPLHDALYQAIRRAREIVKAYK